MFYSFVFAEEPNSDMKIPITLIPAITQNILTIVSFLIGTSSFILGLRMQNAEYINFNFGTFTRTSIAIICINE